MGRNCIKKINEPDCVKAVAGVVRRVNSDKA